MNAKNDNKTIRSACKDVDCSTCSYVNKPTCFNTEKRNRTSIYLLRM
jgi:hypothetical protein